MREPRRDEVDELVEAWARERSDLDLAPVAVFSRISRLARHLDLARRAAFTAHGIESWEFDVLAALRRIGDPYELAPGELARHTMVTTGAMSKRIDRLEESGLVTRRTSVGDRRGRVVGLTPAGLAVIDEAFTAHIANEHRLVAPLTDEERADLERLLARWLEALEGPDLVSR